MDCSPWVSCNLRQTRPKPPDVAERIDKLLLVAVLFWAFLLSALGFVFAQGGLLERSFACFLLICAGVTFALNHVFGFEGAWIWVLLVDTVILAVGCWLVAKSHAHWPIWFVGFHLITVASYLAYLLFPTKVTGLYGNAAGFWALPALAAFVLGTLMDRRTHAPLQSPL